MLKKTIFEGGTNNILRKTNNFWWEKLTHYIIINLFINQN